MHMYLQFFVLKPILVPAPPKKRCFSTFLDSRRQHIVFIYYCASLLFRKAPQLLLKLIIRKLWPTNFTKLFAYQLKKKCLHGCLSWRGLLIYVSRNQNKISASVPLCYFHGGVFLAGSFVSDSLVTNEPCLHSVQDVSTLLWTVTIYISVNTAYGICTHLSGLVFFFQK